MREGLEFDTGVRSDTAPLSTLVGAILAAGDRMAAGIKHALQWRLQVRLNVGWQ